MDHRNEHDAYEYESQLFGDEAAGSDANSSAPQQPYVNNANEDLFPQHHDQPSFTEGLNNVTPQAGTPIRHEPPSDAEVLQQGAVPLSPTTKQGAFIPHMSESANMPHANTHTGQPDIGTNTNTPQSPEKESTKKTTQASHNTSKTNDNPNNKNDNKQKDQGKTKANNKRTASECRLQLNQMQIEPYLITTRHDVLLETLRKLDLSDSDLVDYRSDLDQHDISSIHLYLNANLPVVIETKKGNTITYELVGGIIWDNYYRLLSNNKKINHDKLSVAILKINEKCLESIVKACLIRDICDRLKDFKLDSRAKLVQKLKNILDHLKTDANIQGES